MTHIIVFHFDFPIAVLLFLRVWLLLLSLAIALMYCCVCVYVRLKPCAVNIGTQKAHLMPIQSYTACQDIQKTYHTHFRFKLAMEKIFFENKAIGRGYC